MKKTMKYIVKLLYVVVIPLAVLTSSIKYLVSNWGDVSLSLMIGIAIVSILTIFNALAYSSMLSYIKLMPTINVDTGLVLGLCIAYVDSAGTKEITIIIPFMVIEIQL